MKMNDGSSSSDDAASYKTMGGHESGIDSAVLSLSRLLFISLRPLCVKYFLFVLGG